ncbi:MAG: homoserine kinase [Micrococcales bacterium]|nr:homoserine kinase [Micrococcales bacterium]
MPAGMVAVPAGTAVRVEVPATTANLGPGFDSIGLALGVFDRLEVTVTDEPGLVIDVEGQGADTVPHDESHLVYRTMVRAWGDLGVEVPEGLRLSCHNTVPHASGMGSSSAAIVSGIVAAQALSRANSDGELLDLDWVNSLAALLEGHPDNSSACVYGGFTVSWSEDPEQGTRTLCLPVHPDLEPVVFNRAAQLSTATARSVLPAQVRLADAAANSARTALLSLAVTAHPAYLLEATRDYLHQEPRRRSYAASMELVDRLRAAGHAAAISGAGPSVCALTTRDRAAEVAGFAGEEWTALRPGVPAVGARAEVLARP